LSLGDVGQWDGEGNLKVFGRKDDLIIRGGQNIQPGEIENHLLTHPDIKQAAVVGMPDPVMGQKVCAYVVARSDNGISLEKIVAHLRSRQIAPYKFPERIEVVVALPMVSDTKIDKKALAADIAAKLARTL
jgi:non-ribosomal peptide synthetase component E (peptide arylation enzyme)